MWLQLRRGAEGSAEGETAWLGDYSFAVYSAQDTTRINYINALRPKVPLGCWANHRVMVQTEGRYCTSISDGERLGVSREI
ncbi:hypothetical protein CEXT_540911 [Caerostris extrusa]|uniref:Uncharacterized protein n=1 Tax=Caerostris extrusa TaxID=172846 RepID=A0AAV4N751_CAEEX|nr:hypothetical protein CEXT_540911 [Caerostris extrusa]